MSHATVLVALDVKSYGRKEIESLVEWQMRPFDENQRCFRDGSRWDWWQIGGRYSGSLGDEDIVRKSALNTEALLARHAEGARETWAQAHDPKHLDPEMAAMIYGLQKGETEEQFVQRHTNLAFYAFLRNRHWHESERLGWFGGTAKTECEIATGEEPKGKCLHRDKKTGAKIIVWNEPHEKWCQKFWKRFVEPLPPETLLVVVDYHV